jgi:general secretion pathway protein N
VNAADRRRLTPSLGTVAAVLLLVLIALWLGLGRGAHWHDDAAPPKLPPLGTNLPAPTVPPLEQYAATWQHPLFNPSRIPEAAAGNGDEATGDLQLTGVIMLPDLKMAILHGGPTLVELHPRSAVVETSGSRVNLQLIPGPSPDASAPAQDEAQPPQSAGQGASAMVSRQAPSDAGRLVPRAGPGEPSSAEARARQLKARIEAARRRAARQHDDGG